MPGIGGPPPMHRFNPSLPPSTDDLLHRRVAELRDSAWRLEQTAWMLERASLYEQADKVRELARQLRLDAREARERLESSPPKSGPIFSTNLALPAR
jgi:hypothetical protein